MNFREAKELAQKIRGSVIKRIGDDSFVVIYKSGEVVASVPFIAEEPLLIVDLAEHQCEPLKNKELRNDHSICPGGNRSRKCLDCGKTISSARLDASPNTSRCMACQSTYEKTHDIRQYIDEGLSGSRAENKKMRGQLWGDMRNRGRGK